MLRNEVWQCSSGVVPRPEHEYYYYIGRNATGDWSNSTPADGKMEKGKILAIAGLGIRLAWVLKTMRSILCSSTIFLHHFPTLIGAGQHAQGLHKGRKWVKGAKITRFAWNGRKITRFACNGRQLVRWCFEGLALTCARTDFRQTGSNTSLYFLQHFCVCSKYKFAGHVWKSCKFWLVHNSWEDLIRW